MTPYRVPYGGPVFGPEEREAAIKAYDSGIYWNGPSCAQFEKDIAKRVGALDAIFTNSGSSALLLALEALKHHGLKRGDKVLTVALTFPTAVNILFQQGYKPVFLDVAPDSLNVQTHIFEKAVQKVKPKAAIITHVIGNSPNMKAIMEICQRYNVRTIEDACDCIGGKFDGQSVGTFADFGCYSFHPAHPLTAGMGGAVVAHSSYMAENLRGYRDWGRRPQNYLPEERFELSMRNGRPIIFDRRYTYNQIGYNLMCSEIHAAIGIEQLKKLDLFLAIRRANFEALEAWRERVDTDYAFYRPEVHPNAEPVWFGYPIIRKLGQYTKEGFMNFLENRGIETRSIYGGPIMDQPAYQHLRPGRDYEIFEKEWDLMNSRQLFRGAFWVSLWHGLKADQVKYLTDTLTEFMRATRRR